MGKTKNSQDISSLSFRPRCFYFYCKKSRSQRERLVSRAIYRVRGLRVVRCQPTKLGRIEERRLEKLSPLLHGRQTRRWRKKGYRGKKGWRRRLLSGGGRTASRRARVGGYRMAERRGGSSLLLRHI